MQCVMVIVIGRSEGLSGGMLTGCHPEWIECITVFTMPFDWIDLIHIDLLAKWHCFTQCQFRTFPGFAIEN